MSENRIIDLETKIAYQDKAIEDLSNTVFQLDQKLEQVKLVCDGLKLKLSSLTQQAGVEVGEHNEKPPHY